MFVNGFWDITGCTDSWRFLRISNTGSPNNFCCSGIEFYGTLEGINGNGNLNKLYKPNLDN